MKRSRHLVLPALGLVLAAGQLSAPTSASAVAAPERAVATTAVDLGTAATYSVLGATGVTSTGTDTVLGGDLGLSPTGAITGFGPGLGTVLGVVHDKDAAAAAAQADRQAAYDDADDRTGGEEFAGDQIGQTFTPGLHHSAGAFANTGVMTLDAGGDPDAVFVFQVDAAFSPAAASSVVLAGDARASNVFWQVLGAVSIGQDSSYVGTFLTEGAVTLGQDVTLTGRALSAGAVTLADNAVTPPDADTTAPVVTIDGGARRTTEDATPTVSGTTDARVGRDVTVTVGEQSVTTAVAAGGVWEITATRLANGSYPVTAEVTDGAGNTGVARQTLRVAVPVVATPRYRPDASVRLAGRAPVGVGVYGGTARQTVSQVLQGKVRRTRVLIRIENTGTVGERLRVRGTARQSAFTVVYRLRGVDITRAVTSGTFRTRRLAPGLATAITATVTRSAAGRAGNRATFRVVATSTRAPGARKQDAVALGVRIARR